MYTTRAEAVCAAVGAKQKRRARNKNALGYVLAKVFRKITNQYHTN